MGTGAGAGRETVWKECTRNPLDWSASHHVDLAAAPGSRSQSRRCRWRAATHNHTANASYTRWVARRAVRLTAGPDSAGYRECHPDSPSARTADRSRRTPGPHGKVCAHWRRARARLPALRRPRRHQRHALLNLIFSLSATVTILTVVFSCRGFILCVPRCEVDFLVAGGNFTPPGLGATCCLILFCFLHTFDVCSDLITQCRRLKVITQR